jgi:hypothetical protein
VQGGNTIGPIQPNQCQSVSVIIGRPTGFTTAGLTGCYDVTATSVSNSSVSMTERGSVTDRRDLCPLDDNADDELVVGVPQPVAFTIRNDDVPSGIIPYRIQAYDSDMEPSGAMTLDGHYPGVASDGVANIPLGSTGQIAVEVLYRWTEPFDFTDIVLSTDADDNGLYEPLLSVGTRSNASPLSDAEAAGGSALALGSCFPNPTRQATMVAFNLRGTGPVRVAIFDVAGRVIRDLMNHPLGPGDHVVSWDGRDESGHEVSTGLYFAEVQARGARQSMKILMVR